MKELPIVFSLDDKFAVHCAVCIASILKNISDRYLPHIYIITDSMSSDNREKIKETAKLKTSKLDFIDISSDDNEEFKKFALPEQWSHSIFYRLKIPSLLKEHTKAIYLDSDVVATHDIGELFDLDISDYILGACNEYDCSPETARIQSERINLPENIGYFNTGVLLLNLEKMREEGIEQKCIELLTSGKQSSITYPDQDALNIATDGKYLHLPNTWNTQIWAKKDFPRIYRRKNLPNIIHFSGVRKPWKMKKFKIFLNFSQKSGCFRQYFKYLRYTPWWK